MHPDANGVAVGLVFLAMEALALFAYARFMWLIAGVARAS
jgi:hypothetical protein